MYILALVKKGVLASGKKDVQAFKRNMYLPLKKYVLTCGEQNSCLLVDG